MTAFKLLTSALYVALGAVIAVRLLALGFHTETVSGLVLAAALVALGAYRLLQFYRRAGGG